MSEQKVEITKASKKLQDKVGTGKIDAHKIEKCEDVMENNDIDFAPMASEFLGQLKDAIEEGRNGAIDKDQLIKSTTDPVMQLKANAAIFKYSLVGNLANIMLSFLEAIEDIDDHVLDIVDAHYKTLAAIVAKKMKGDGGLYGQQLEDELKDACKRYFSRKKKDL